MTKSLADIIGEVYTQDMTPRAKEFVALHKVDKVRGLSEPTDDDKLFNATNVSKSAHKEVSEEVETIGGEQIIFEFVDYGYSPSSDPQRAQNDQMQHHLDQSRQYMNMADRAKSMTDRHRHLSNDKNTDTKVRNLHSKVVDHAAQLQALYAKLAGFHNGAIGELLNAKKD